LKEEEIRPQKIFDEFLRLAREDTKTYFSDAERVSSNCPACEEVGIPAFVKNGFTYETCPNCLSLYVNPRPAASVFSRYYTESPSAEFWAKTFYKETADARREKLWKPKARLIHETLNLYNAGQYTLVDIGGGFGLFAEEMRSLCGQSPIIIEPGPQLAEVCRKKSFTVIEKFLEQVVQEDLPAGHKAFVCFELFEHLHDPSLFLKNLYSLMVPGDLFIFTTLSSSGVDIQVLWDESKSVAPPHHLNFLNPHSIELLLGRIGYESIKVTTPGRLDIDILVNNHTAIKDRFWRTFISTASDSEKEDWQKVITASRYSSHMMVICRKPLV
jgi:hypothetical protein